MFRSIKTIASSRLALASSAVPIACALLVLCGGLWVVMGQAVFTEYTGTITPAGLVNPGTLECLNGQPSGVPWYVGSPCSPPDSRVRIRGVVIKYYQQTSDPRTTGWLFVTINANLDQWPGSGPFWGTARLEVAQGGVWEGTWTGERTLTSETLRAEGHGSGGIVEGLKFEAQMSRTASSPIFPKYNVSGTILQPAGK